MLGRKHGFVFYEGDCIMQSLNPFIDLNVEELTMVQNQQTPLKVKFTNYLYSESSAVEYLVFKNENIQV